MIRISQQLRVVNVRRPHDHSQRQSTPRRSAASVLYRFSPDLWGWGRRDPPEPGLDHRAVGGLPLDESEVVAVLHQYAPDASKHAAFDPALEGAVDGGVVPEALGKLIPLHARAEAVEDAVEGPAGVGAWPTRTRLGVEFPEHRKDRILPEVVGDVPDHGQFVFGLATCHPWFLEVEGMASSSAISILLR